jgi:hypothetical protein
MTKFTKETLLSHNEWLHYYPHGERSGAGQFVARFKHMRDGMGSFKTFLIKNFTVEEYFAAREAGVSPLKILQAKGYLQPHIKRWLKEGGYTVDKAGYEKYIADRLKATYARIEAAKAA